MERPQVSIIVPVYNEEANVGPLAEAVSGALDGWSRRWELVLVDDGSQDGTAQVVAAVARSDPRVRLIQLVRNYGQTSAMQAGLDHALGDVVVSMDGDLQNDPRDIPRLVARLDDGFDLVAGYRENRQDKWFTRRLPSQVANWLIRRVTGVQIRDNGCSLKAYSGELAKRLNLYADMHRFIPALAAATAGARITEIPVRHHARRFGKSKYGLSRVALVLVDLLTVTMIRSFSERPLALFAVCAFGALTLGIAFGVAGVVSYAMFAPTKANALVFPAASLLWLGLACYLLLLGLIAEVAVREYRPQDGRDLPVLGSSS